MQNADVWLQVPFAFLVLQCFLWNIIKQYIVKQPCRLHHCKGFTCKASTWLYFCEGSALDGSIIRGYSQFRSRYRQGWVLLIHAEPWGDAAFWVKNKNKPFQHSESAESLFEWEPTLYLFTVPASVSDDHDYGVFTVLFTVLFTVFTCAAFWASAPAWHIIIQKHTCKHEFSLMWHLGSESSDSLELCSAVCVCVCVCVCFQVIWAEQQISKRRCKRDIHIEPTDPKFPQQWYLVC